MSDYTYGAGLWVFQQFVDRYATDAYGPPVGTLEAIERAAQVITERTRFQVWDSLFEAPAEYRMGRMLLAGRERRTRANRGEQDGLNCMCGIPTPRTEQLWHSLRHQWCSPRGNAAGWRGIARLR